jgi:hypothetical protein
MGRRWYKLALSIGLVTDTGVQVKFIPPNRCLRPIALETQARGLGVLPLCLDPVAADCNHIDCRRKGTATLNNKTEGIIDGLAAILILFTAMLDPRVSVGLAVVALFGLAIYKFRHKAE